MYKQTNNIVYIAHIHTIRHSNIITMDFNCFVSVVSTWMELQRRGALREHQQEDEHNQLDKVGIQTHTTLCFNLEI